MEVDASYEFDLDERFEEYLTWEYKWRKEEYADDPDDFIHDFEDCEEYIQNSQCGEWEHFFECFSESEYGYLVETLKEKNNGSTDVTISELYSDCEKWVPFFKGENSILVADSGYRHYRNYFAMGIKYKPIPDWLRIESDILSGKFLDEINKESDLNYLTYTMNFSCSISFGEYMEEMFEAAELYEGDYYYYYEPVDVYFKENWSDTFKDEDFDLYRNSTDDKSKFDENCRCLSEKFHSFDEIDFYSTDGYLLSNYEIVRIEDELFSIDFGENVQLVAKHKEEEVIEIRDWKIIRKTPRILNTKLEKIKKFEVENNIIFYPLAFDETGASLFISDSRDECDDDKRYCVCVNFFTGEHSIIFKINTNYASENPLEIAKKILKGGAKEVFKYAMTA